HSRLLIMRCIEYAEMLSDNVWGEALNGLDAYVPIAYVAFVVQDNNRIVFHFCDYAVKPFLVNEHTIWGDALFRTGVLDFLMMFFVRQLAYELRVSINLSSLANGAEGDICTKCAAVFLKSPNIGGDAFIGSGSGEV